MPEVPATYTLDVRGLLCPMPVIRTQDRVKGLLPGSIVEVVATDAGTLHDIPAWCRVHGHELLQIVESDPPAARTWGGREIRFRLRVSK